LENLSKIRDSLSAIKPLENKAAALDTRLQIAKTEVAALLEKYEKESLDVLKIQQETIASFVLKLFGKYDDRIEQEKREEIEAKLNYDRALAKLDEFMQGKQELASQLSVLRRQALAYESELENRREYIQQRLSEPDGQQYRQYEDKRRDMMAQITEIDEALKAAMRVTETAQSAAASLKKAEGWATYDIWSRSGFITHAAKYSHIDSAESCFHRLTSQIDDLRRELRDVDELFDIDLTQISGTQRAVDFWFDNIFTDLSVRSKIRDNIEQLNHLIRKVNDVQTMLRDKHRDLNLQLDDIKRRQEDLLLKMYFMIQVPKALES
jgi:hypothetical protein